MSPRSASPWSVGNSDIAAFSGDLVVHLISRAGWADLALPPAPSDGGDRHVRTGLLDGSGLVAGADLVVAHRFPRLLALLPSLRRAGPRVRVISPAPRARRWAALEWLTGHRVESGTGVEPADRLASGNHPPAASSRHEAAPLRTADRLLLRPVASRRLGTDLLIAGPDAEGSVERLTGSGPVLWALLGSGLTLEEVAQRAADDFGLARADVEDDLMQFANSLVATGLATSA